MGPIVLVVNGHEVSCWNIDEGRWETYRPWMRWCPWMLVRIDGQYATSESFDNLSKKVDKPAP